MTGLDDLDALDSLETRLGRLDLRLAAAGEHLSDERIALIGAGEDPSDADAAHLAGCDECIDLLVALGEGLEALADEQPQLGVGTVAAPEPPTLSQPSRRRARWAVVAIVLFAGAAAAAAGWLIRAAGSDRVEHDRGVESRERRGAQGARADAGSTEVPILPAEQVVGQRMAASSGESTGGEVGAGGGGDLPAIARRLDALLGHGVGASAQTFEELDPPAPEPPLADNLDAHRATSTPTRAADPHRPAPPLGALERRDGPRPLERMPVDGPPRGFGHLQLNTRPPARVFIDGKPHGWTPVIDLRLSEGPHDVHLIFDSALAAEPEQRFRVLIEPDRTWRMTRDNVRRPARQPPPP